MRRIELRPILCNKYHCIAYLKMLLSSGNDRAESVTIIKCNEREEMPLPFLIDLLSQNKPYFDSKSLMNELTEKREEVYRLQSGRPLAWLWHYHNFLKYIIKISGISGDLLV